MRATAPPSKSATGLGFLLALLYCRLISVLQFPWVVTTCQVGALGGGGGPNVVCRFKNWLFPLSLFFAISMTILE